eukprot:TRINITY_DN15731_c0_g1_i1.p1 TRINITY_DN15731_c0_g1~~TRINITY_DN15731_c0_g1_i1.p1  ORF type:complete len:435 (-),score=133.30 TRINITY_DN15731_c0_g1_i1:255-1559(-)
MASFSTSSSKAGSGAGGGAWAKAKHSQAGAGGGGGGILGKIRDIELEMARTQKNKATTTHLGSLKAKLCQLRRELMEPSKAGGGKKCPGFEVQKMGHCRVGLVGFPSVGKSSLLSALTGVQSEVAAYEFTTLTCIPGVIRYNDIEIQLLDLPGIIVGAASGKGRGRQVIATAKSCDIILMCLDPTKEDGQIEMLTKELEDIGIRLNTAPKDIQYTKTNAGGVKFHSTVPQTQGFDGEVAASVLKSYRTFNANVICREDVSVDDFIDIIDGNRKYCKCLYVYTKIDLLDLKTIDELSRRPMSVCLSVHWKLNFDYLLKRMWDEMQVVRVFTKKKGCFPDFSDPLILTNQRGTKKFDVENAVTLLHKQILEEFKCAQVWGGSVKASPTFVGLKHELQDEDVMQIVKKTQAEKVKALTGKKTGSTIAGTNIKKDPKH